MKEYEQDYYADRRECCDDDHECDSDSDEGGNSMWCPFCHKQVTTTVIDFGIGAYEYWGAPGVDKDLQEVCPECEAHVSDLLDEEPEPDLEELEDEEKP